MIDEINSKSTQYYSDQYTNNELLKKGKHDFSRLNRSRLQKLYTENYQHISHWVVTSTFQFE